MKIKGKKLLLCMAAVIMIGGAKAQGTDAPVATMDLTLKEAISVALAENPTIKVAEKEIELKERNVAITEKALEAEIKKKAEAEKAENQPVVEEKKEEK